MYRSSDFLLYHFFEVVGMKLVVNVLGFDIEIEGEINKEENEKELTIRIENIHKAVLRFQKIEE